MEQNLTEKQKAIIQLNSIVKNNYWQDKLKAVLGENAGTFTTSIVEVVSNDANLCKCDQKKVMEECMKAATLHLPINKQLGFAYILPFNNYNKETKTTESVPTLVIGYRGIIQMAIRSGLYKKINADVVFEGEFNGYDKLTGDLDMSGQKTSDNVVGFFAYFELTNGFSKTIFMSLEEMAKYALCYSPSMKGKYAPSVDELMKSCQEQMDNDGISTGSVGWKSDFVSMALKTILRKLLTHWGYLSIEMQTAFADEADAENNQVNVRDEVNEQDKIVIEAEVVEEDSEEAPI